MLIRDTFGPADAPPMAHGGGDNSTSLSEVLTPLGLTEDGLAGATLKALQGSFVGFGHSLTSEMWDGLAAVAGVLETMANGTCPKSVYVSSLDPGVGKTQLLVHFLRELLRSPGHRGASAIICANRKDQIRAIATEAGLDQFAVLTSDDDLNAIATADPNEARILFTTHQMVEARCRNSNSFEAVSAFHYEGGPRMVRIWDEAMLPGEPIAVTLDDLNTIPAEVRTARPRFTADFDKVISQIVQAEEGDRIELPNLPRIHDFAEQEARRMTTGRAAKAVELIWPLFGRTVTVRRRYRISILDYRESLPADLQPVMVLDASARVRATYDLWERHRGGMQRLPSATKSYAGLTIGIWDRGGGKDTFSYDAPTIAEGVVKTINARPNEDWLVVHHKATADFDFEKLVKQRLSTSGAGKVKFVTWGRHDATNDFAHIPNVILAGVLFKPEPAYEATGRASAALPSASGAFQWTDEVRRGEHAHGILQALCRGAVRRLQNGCCPASRAFIIAHKGSGIPALLAKVFPGASIGDWLPIPKPLKGHAETAFDYIISRVEADASEVIPPADVYRHLGVTKDNFKSVRGQKNFRAALEAYGVRETTDVDGQPPGFWHPFRYYFGDEDD
ncbi:hypothetical protein CO669_23010 [Bradyrhizobium sp. Y36]|uniref:hypothetical protein n=1 Tax=Bradyrhizobium sp. Y36 TaxID=2035447 RepID=UPI000BE83B56|nr:hypothetical protein [Bradyrhizobium sp. Y36]PDT87750.1 hypothetical protein CO669_23010 [Bradyrhizobium sp. Y36]